MPHGASSNVSFSNGNNYKNVVALNLVRSSWGSVTHDLAEVLLSSSEGLTVSAIAQCFHSIYVRGPPLFVPQNKSGISSSGTKEIKKISKEEIQESLILLKEHNCLLVVTCKISSQEYDASASRFGDEIDFEDRYRYMLDVDNVLNRLQYPTACKYVRSLVGETGIKVLDLLMLKGSVGWRHFAQDIEMSPTLKIACMKMKELKIIVPVGRLPTFIINQDDNNGDGRSSSGVSASGRSNKKMKSSYDNDRAKMKPVGMDISEAEAKEDDDDDEVPSAPAATVVDAKQVEIAEAIDSKRKRPVMSLGADHVDVSLDDIRSQKSDSVKYDGIANTDSRLWTISWDEINQLNLYDYIVKITEAYVDIEAAAIVKVILDRSSGSYESAMGYFSAIVRLSTIYDDIRNNLLPFDHWNQLKAMYKKQSSNGLLDLRKKVNVILNSPLHILEEVSGSSGVGKEGSILIRVDISAALDLIQTFSLRDMVSKKHGPAANKLLGVFIDGNYHEQSKLHNFAIMTPKDSRVKLYELYLDNWLETLEVSKHKDSYTTDSMTYLFFFNKTKVMEYKANFCYKIIYNQMLIVDNILSSNESKILNLTEKNDSDVSASQIFNDRSFCVLENNIVETDKNAILFDSRRMKRMFL